MYITLFLTNRGDWEKSQPLYVNNALSDSVTCTTYSYILQKINYAQIAPVYIGFVGISPENKIILEQKLWIYIQLNHI